MSVQSLRMLPSAEAAIRLFLPANAHELSQNRLRVLLTRVQLGFMRPLLRPEAVSEFASRRYLQRVLRASCHVRTSNSTNAPCALRLSRSLARLSHRYHSSPSTA